MTSRSSLTRTPRMRFPERMLHRGPYDNACLDALNSTERVTMPQPAFEDHPARFSRRQALKAAALWTMAAVGLAACAGPPGQAVPSSGTPSATGTPAATAPTVA